jgi:hypothetical protein
MLWNPMHPLDRYFKATGITPAEFIARMKTRGFKPTSVAYLRQLKTGWRHPSRKMARAMSSTADGEVTVAELLTYEPPTADVPPALPRRKASRSRKRSAA